MQPLDPCDRFRRQCAADPCAESREPSTDGAQAHAAACPACRAWLARRVRAVQVVATLDRVPAPAALDRRVAEELTLAGLTRHRAPEVLDRLLAEELAAGTGATAARSLASLRRLTAPAELDRRIDALLSPAAAPSALRGRIGTPRARIRNWTRPAPALAAAAVLLVGTLGLLPAGDGGRTADRPLPRTRLVMLDSPAGLEPVAAGLLHGLRGAPPASFPAGSRADGAQPDGGRR